MTTIKLVGAGGKELASIGFAGHQETLRIQTALHVDHATFHNAILLALVTYVGRTHKDGNEVAISVAGVAGPTYRKA